MMRRRVAYTSSTHHRWREGFLSLRFSYELHRYAEKLYFHRSSATGACGDLGIREAAYPCIWSGCLFLFKSSTARLSGMNLTPFNLDAYITEK